MGNAAQDLRSVGHIAHELNVSARTVRNMATSLGAVPAMRLNGVEYFAAADADLIHAELTADRLAGRHRGQRARRQS